ncbi:MAG: hypothetical protein GY949_20920, partial [Gammaproteobacteria bacterium]|nr:hypothetical protein [Gammaproteobacteria bacterium]
FTEDTGATTALFAAAIDTIETGDTISQVILTLANVEAGDTLSFGATDIDLDTNGATVAGGFTYTVSSAGATPVVTITHAGADDASVNTMLNSAVFNNTSNNDPSTTARTVTFTSVTDSGSGTTADGTVATVNVVAANDAPLATADNWAVNEDTTTNFDLVANDSDPELDTITLLGFERVVANYDAAASGTAPDPTTVDGGGWTLTETEDGDVSTGTLTAVGLSPDGTGGLNAWNVDDANQGAGENLFYSLSLNAADTTLADSYGWHLSSTLRFDTDYTDTTTHRLIYGNGTTQFRVDLDIGASGNLNLTLVGTGGGGYAVTSGGTGTDSYHDIDVLFDAGTGFAAVLVDGQRIDTGSWSGQASAANGVTWGAASGGGRGSVNYHDVSLSVFDQTAATTAGGSVTNNGDGTVDYTPAGNYTGADSFNYTITDGEGNLASAPVSVTVNATNDAPTLAATAANDILTENTDTTSAAVFSTVTIDPIEIGDDIASAQLTIAGGIENTDTLTINGTAITGLGSDSSGAITGGHSYSYTQATGVVTITFAGST